MPFSVLTRIASLLTISGRPHQLVQHRTHLVVRRHGAGVLGRPRKPQKKPRRWDAFVGEPSPPRRLSSSCCAAAFARCASLAASPSVDPAAATHNAPPETRERSALTLTPLRLGCSFFSGVPRGLWPGPGDIVRGSEAVMNVSYCFLRCFNMNSLCLA